MDQNNGKSDGMGVGGARGNQEGKKKEGRELISDISRR